MTRAARKAKLDAAYDRFAQAVVNLVWPIAKREIERAAARRPAARRHHARRAAA